MSDKIHKMKATEIQIGGSHYKELAMSPLKYILANNLSYCLGNVIKYVSRKKGSKEDQIKDLLKAKHYIDLELENEYKVDVNGNPLIG